MLPSFGASNLNQPDWTPGPSYLLLPLPPDGYLQVSFLPPTRSSSITSSVALTSLHQIASPLQCFLSPFPSWLFFSAAFLVSRSIVQFLAIFWVLSVAGEFHGAGTWPAVFILDAQHAAWHTEGAQEISRERTTRWFLTGQEHLVITPNSRPTVLCMPPWFDRRPWRLKTVKILPAVRETRV